MSMHRMIMFLIFLTAQAMVFGLGTAIVLATPSLMEQSNVLLPAVNIFSLVVGAIAGWLLTPIVRARYAAKHGVPVRAEPSRREP
jgi:flagellar biosynthesis protein FliQ